jgi:glucokinase
MYLGIEIGGTKLQLGVGPGDGTLVGLWRGNVDLAAGGPGIRRQILAAVPELLAPAHVERKQLRGVAVGFGGPVDDATRRTITSHQVAGWDDFPLADWLTESLNMPAVLGNDADLAGLAEALLGAGHELSPVFYVTLGSGVGGGLVIDGKIFRGSGRGAAEIGHLEVASPDGERMILEKVASGWGIADGARRRLERGEGLDSLVMRNAGGRAADVTATHVGDAARLGDDFALAVLGRAIDALAEAVCHVVALTCPRRIVIGGGVSLLGEQLLFEPLRQRVAARVFRPFAGLSDIVPAAFGETVVVHGST